MGSNAFGQSLARKEDTRLLTGAGRFTADLLRPGMAHAAMLRSPHAHADILSIDIAAASAMPGVLAVLTAAEYAADGLGGIPSGSALIRFPGTPPDQDFAFRPARPALAPAASASLATPWRWWWPKPPPGARRRRGDRNRL